MSMKEYLREIDAVYPEHLSRLHRVGAGDTSPAAMYRRQVKKKMHKSGGRYRTQPVTFDEIKVNQKQKSEYRF